MTRRFIQEVKPEDRQPGSYYLCCSVPNDTLPFHTPNDTYYGPLTGVQLTYFELRDTESGDPVARYSAEDGWWFVLVENAGEDDGEGLAGPYSDIVIEMYRPPAPDTIALWELAEDMGLDGEDLDEAVHDAASRIGSDVNNQGLDRQIQFLAEQLGARGAEEEIRAAVEESDEDGEDDEDWDGSHPPAPLLVRHKGMNVYHCWDSGEQDVLRSYIFTTSPSGNEDGRLAFDVRDLAGDLNEHGVEMPNDYHGDADWPKKVAIAAIDAGLLPIGSEGAWDGAEGEQDDDWTE